MKLHHLERDKYKTPPPLVNQYILPAMRLEDNLALNSSKFYKSELLLNCDRRRR